MRRSGDRRLAQDDGERERGARASFFLCSFFFEGVDGASPRKGNEKSEYKKKKKKRLLRSVESRPPVHALLASLQAHSASRLLTFDARYHQLTRTGRSKLFSLEKETIDSEAFFVASVTEQSIDRRRPQQPRPQALFFFSFFVSERRHRRHRRRHAGQERALPFRPGHLALRESRLLRRRLHALHRREHRRDRGVPRGRGAGRGADEPVESFCLFAFLPFSFSFLVSTTRSRP